MISDRSSRHFPALPGLHPSIHRLTKPGWFRVVGVWIERSRQRRALANLDNRFLKDIGITRSQAARECAKPFWRK